LNKDSDEDESENENYTDSKKHDMNKRNLLLKKIESDEDQNKSSYKRVLV